MCAINKKGDKTHPCDAPVLMVMMDDRLAFFRTYCCLLVRKSSANNCSLAGILYRLRPSIRV